MRSDMIIDELFHLKDYAGLHPAFETIARFLETHEWDTMADGRYDFGLEGGWVNLQTVVPKTEGQAVLEAHRRMIDVQVPLSCVERMGYAPCPPDGETVYDAEKDIAFYKQPFDTVVTVHCGMFAVFFPQDAHAPGITAETLRKAVFKLPLLETTRT